MYEETNKICFLFCQGDLKLDQMDQINALMLLRAEKMSFRLRLHMHITVQLNLNLHHWTFTLTESFLLTVAEGRRHLQRKKAAQFLVCDSVGAAGNSCKNSSARALKQHISVIPGMFQSCSPAAPP